jgi:hypothetical protein
MEQRQHVLSEWLLKAFAGPTGGSYIVAAYDKSTGQYVDHDVDDFMVEIGAHSAEVEAEISRIEGPAAQAARTLFKRAKHYPAGIYAVTTQEEDLRATGPALSDKGLFRDTRLLVSEHTVRTPLHAERAALARYAGLMYQRAPTTEASILNWGETFDRGIQDTLDQILPGQRSPVQTTLAHRRGRMVELAERIADVLTAASWFIVRTGQNESFVLSDSPVAATITFGFDDEWRAILSAESYAILMPLNPAIALVFAPRHILPLSRIDASELVPAINRVMWRAAGRYVLGRSQQELEAALGDADEETRRYSIQPSLDAEAIARQARTTTEQVVAEVMVEVGIKRPLANFWAHWTGCRLEFGYALFAAEDRNLLLGAPHPRRR